MHTLLLALFLFQDTANNHVSDKEITRIEFHDSEPPVEGCVGCLISYGTNNIFRLAQMPLPELSLILVSDHRVLIQGIDYTLRNDGLIEIIEIKSIPRTSLLAWYRIEH